MTNWFVARYRTSGGPPEVLEGVGDEYIDGWLDLSWPTGPEGQEAFGAPDESEFAVVIPDGRILLFPDVDEMYEGWVAMEGTNQWP